MTQFRCRKGAAAALFAVFVCCSATGEQLLDSALSSEMSGSWVANDGRGHEVVVNIRVIVTPSPVLGHDSIKEVAVQVYPQESGDADGCLVWMLASLTASAPGAVRVRAGTAATPDVLDIRFLPERHEWNGQVALGEFRTVTTLKRPSSIVTGRSASGTWLAENRCIHIHSSGPSESASWQDIKGANSVTYGVPLNLYIGDDSVVLNVLNADGCAAGVAGSAYYTPPGKTHLGKLSAGRDQLIFRDRSGV